MNTSKIEYLPLLISWFFAFGLGLLIIKLSQRLSPKTFDLEKSSAYECGFDPFGDARIKFDVRFYLVSILFLVFDLELMFVFPWTVTLASIETYGYITMIIFLFIVVLGFVYEWYHGALDWE